MTKQFYRDTLKMLIPMVLQNILAAMMGSVDVVMLNYVGQTSLSAGSLATQYTSILFMVFNGIGSGAILLSAQYYGRGDYEALKTIEGIALKFSLAVSLVFALAAALAPRVLMRIYTPDAALIEEGARYLRVIWAYYILWGISNVYFAMLRSAGHVAEATCFNALSFVLNIILNSAFIFGLFGIPRMGITGVALATCISQAVSVAGCFVVSHFNRIIKLRLSYMALRSGALMKDFFTMAVPALLNDVSWGLAFSVYVAIMGRLGSDVVAANSIVVVVRNFATAFSFGVAGVGGIIVGNLMGASKLDEAEAAAKSFMKITVFAGAVGGVLIAVSIPFVLDFVSITDTAKTYLRWMLIINTYYIMGSSVNTTLISGIFRAGGNTRFGLICDTIDMWGYGVPAGLLTAFVFKLPVVWVYFFLCLDEFVKWPWVLSYYKSRKWLVNITRDTY